MVCFFLPQSFSLIFSEFFFETGADRGGQDLLTFKPNQLTIFVGKQGK